MVFFFLYNCYLISCVINYVLFLWHAAGYLPTLNFVCGTGVHIHIICLSITKPNMQVI